MKTTIKWDVYLIRKRVEEGSMNFDTFKKLCKTQYKEQYSKIKNEDIQKEYEHLTGEKIKKV